MVSSPGELPSTTTVPSAEAEAIVTVVLEVGSGTIVVAKYELQSWAPRPDGKAVSNATAR